MRARPNEQPTDRQTDRRAHREVTLSITLVFLILILEYDSCRRLATRTDIYEPIGQGIWDTLYDINIFPDIMG